MDVAVCRNIEVFAVYRGSVRRMVDFDPFRWKEVQKSSSAVLDAGGRDREVLKTKFQKKSRYRSLNAPTYESKFIRKCPIVRRVVVCEFGIETQAKKGKAIEVDRGGRCGCREGVE